MHRAILLTTGILMAAPSAWADQQLSIQYDIPDIDARKYHRPYVAIWIETADREPVQTISLLKKKPKSWRKKNKWLDDLTQWWRATGKETVDELDGVTGATRGPGTYSTNISVPDGSDWVILFEAVREKGGRSFVKQKLNDIPAEGATLPAKAEIGPITLKLTDQQ